MSDVAKPAYWVDGEPGLCPQSTPIERLGWAIDRASQAYDALHPVVWMFTGPTEEYLALEKALDTVGQHIDRLEQKRTALRAKE